jgi:heavy metal sensor kinase
VNFSLRTRLALWYALTLAATLGVLGAFVYGWVARTGNLRIDEDLANVASAFAQLWSSAPERPGPDLLSAAHADNFEIVVVDEALREIVSNTRTVRLRRSKQVSHPAVQSADSLLHRPDLAPLFRQVDTSRSAYITLRGPLGLERAYAMAVPVAGRREVVAVIEGLEDQAAFLRALRRSLYLTIPVALLVAFLGGTFLAGRALRPVGQMAEQAGRIGAATLHERLKGGLPGTELGNLAAAFNRLLGRLEAAFEQQHRFMSEASHELRTPIAVVRGEADLSLSRESRPPAEYRESLTVIRAESRRMSRVVDDLFLLARADAGQLQLTLAEVDVAALAVNCCRSVQSLTPLRGISVVCRAAGPLLVRADEPLVGRVLLNLLDNAIRYGKVGGRVELDVKMEDGQASLAVRDSGPGMPPEVQARIFDRFYRGPEARSADGGGGETGAGLGLAIAKGIVEAHGGTLTLHHSGTEGTEFRVRLPTTP